VAEKAVIAKALELQVWPLLVAGRCKPIIHATFPLKEAARAHHMLESGVHTGKIILLP
jgi:NADPH2:quinone reductase